MMAWFVVVTRAQQEARAAIELAKQDFEVYMPILDSKPRFPRYIFTRFNREVDNWGVIRSTRGCIDLLKNGFLPSPVPEWFMESLKNLPAASPEASQEAEVEYAKDQRVKIIDGPGAGLEGLFHKDVKRRTASLLKIMGKTVEVPRKSVRAA